MHWGGQESANAVWDWTLRLSRVNEPAIPELRLDFLDSQLAIYIFNPRLHHFRRRPLYHILSTFNDK